MENIQFSPTHAGLLRRLSRFLKSCAPYSITAPGYSIISATVNVYRALGRAITQSTLPDLPRQTIEDYRHKKEVLLQTLNLGGRQDKGFTTLYKDGYGNYLRSIRRSPITRGILHVLASTLSLVATMLCVVQTLVLHALAITAGAVLLPLVPLFFLLCTTVAIERYAVARVHVAFRTSVREGISNCIKKNLSFGLNKKEVDKPEDNWLTSSKDLAKSTKELHGTPSALESAVINILSTLGEVITLAVCVPVFLLVAPVSLIVSGSVLMLSLCSLSKRTIVKNVETMSHYAINDFLPITSRARDSIQACDSLQKVNESKREFDSLSSLSSMYFDNEIDPLLTTTPTSSWSSKTQLSKDDRATGHALGV